MTGYTFRSKAHHTCLADVAERRIGSFHLSHPGDWAGIWAGPGPPTA